MICSWSPSTGWPSTCRCSCGGGRTSGCNFHGFRLTLWKGPHIDVLLALRFERPQIFRAHSLQFYVRRLGWSDLQKPLSGVEEANVWKTGKWTELEKSIRHDCLATYRLGLWLNLYQPVEVKAANELEPIL